MTKPDPVILEVRRLARHTDTRIKEIHELLLEIGRESAESKRKLPKAMTEAFKRWWQATAHKWKDLTDI